MGGDWGFCAGSKGGSLGAGRVRSRATTAAAARTKLCREVGATLTCVDGGVERCAACEMKCAPTEPPTAAAIASARVETAPRVAAAPLLYSAGLRRLPRRRRL